MMLNLTCFIIDYIFNRITFNKSMTGIFFKFFNHELIMCYLIRRTLPDVYSRAINHCRQNFCNLKRKFKQHNSFIGRFLQARHYQHAQSEIKHPNSSKAPSPFTLTVNEPKNKTQKIK